MTAASYTTDLTTINDGSGTFTEPAGATLGTITVADTDNFVQGTSCNSKTTGATGAPALAGLGFQAGSAQTIVSPNAFYAWCFVGGGGLIDTLANGGIRLLIGQDLNNYRYWYVDGNDYFPYIGWECIAIETDNSVVAATGSQGTPSTTKQYFGVNFNCKINVSKGNPMAVDAIRWGRTITVAFGDLANGYAMFAGIATQNDSINNRWGQFQTIPGGYQLQGRLLLGVTGGNVVDFRDSNVNIVSAISRKTAASFNAIEVQNASSNISWSAINWSALGTVSRGTFTVTDNATVALTSCTFTDLSTFGFLSNTTVTTTTFRRCGKITTGGATIISCTIDSSSSTPAVTTSSPANAALITGTKFISVGTGHGLEITGTAANMTLTNNTWTGYASSDGSTGNEAVYVNIATGSMNLTISGGTTPSVRTAGATVTVVSGAVNATVTVKDTATPPVAIQNAMVLVIAAAGGPMPYNVTVTITRSGSTATVSHTNHGMATNDYVQILGSDQSEYNAVHQITKIDANSYSYTVSGTPATPATGIIKATFTALSGLTDVNGQITMSRVFSSDQPITGRVRKGTSAPYYKTSDIIGTIYSSSGFSATVQLILDQ